MLRSAFGNHPRTLTLINAFSEGINLCSADVGVNTELQASNGFELVRQLTLEYSIRTRSEALSFRTALAGKSFALHGNETSASSLGLKRHRFGMAIGMNHGIVHGTRDRKTGMNLGVGQWEKMLCMTAMLVEQLLECNLSC